MKAGTSIRASTNRVLSMYESTPEIILYQNHESIILDANPAFLQLVGEPRENVIDHNIHEFLPARVHSFFAEKLSEALKGKTVRFDHRGGSNRNSSFLSAHHYASQAV